MFEPFFTDGEDIHRDQPVLAAGEPASQAQAAMLMVHGRGASAESILQLTAELDQPGFAYIAPQAADNTWYPYSFLSPLEDNEPWLASALLAVEHALALIEE